MRISDWSSDVCSSDLFWNDEQIFEFTYITCLYDMHAVNTRALRVEYDAREDPIVEVAAPEGFSAADFLSATRPAQGYWAVERLRSTATYSAGAALSRRYARNSGV